MESKATIINEASECTVKQYIRAKFEGKLRVLLIDGEATDEELARAFDTIETQYVDISKLFETREFEMSAYIDSVGKRVGTVQRFIELQTRFSDEFDMPFLPQLNMLKKYGHTLVWNPEEPDIDYFKKRLSTIENKERKYKSVLSQKVNELVEFKKKIIAKDYSLLENRQQFISMLNRLQQAKFVIDKNETSMEEIGLMIRDYRDQQEEQRIQANAKKGR